MEDIGGTMVEGAGMAKGEAATGATTVGAAEEVGTRIGEMQ